MAVIGATNAESMLRVAGMFSRFYHIRRFRDLGVEDLGVVGKI